jgi:hypothetical protein
MTAVYLILVKTMKIWKAIEALVIMLCVTACCLPASVQVKAGADEK